MRWLPLALVLFLLMVVPSGAQTPADSRSTIHLSTSELAATPEMWFYEQYLRDYRDPKAMVRKKAEFRVAERERRLTMLKWYGIVSSRPSAGSDPVHSDYSARWVSNNHYYPSRWAGFGTGTAVVRSASPTPSSDRPTYLSVP
jgi:hypothetical protein